ncbi:MAG: hypothetical protein NW237_02740 [Cyanobacteriota bacterium]|nr:hypothetical protein [Cyanobacteriota bacterium]
MADQQADFIAGLVTGAVVGGIVGGVIGVILAPKFLKRLSATSNPVSPHSPGSQSLSPSSGIHSQTWQDLQEDADLALVKARETLETKIAELNEAIRDTRAQLLIEEAAANRERV